MKFRHHLPAVALLALTSSAFALKIELRYDQDPNGFFTTYPQAKAVLRAAADFYEPLIHDSLSAINPGGSNTWSATTENPSTGAGGYSIPGFSVAANTIVIFAGGRDLGSAAGRGGMGGQSVSGTLDWANAVRFRGQAGAALTPATDFGRWGGYVSFHTGLTWNFSQTNPNAGGVSFLSVALHEIGHVLGIGPAPSWTAKVSGSNFTGPYSAQVYGGNVPLDGGLSHWRDSPSIVSKVYGAFGTPHGTAQDGLMDPVLPPAGTYNAVMTELDLAALRDVGWEVDPPLDLRIASIRPSANPYVFSWPSTTGYTYRLQRSSTLAPGSWTDLSTQAGNGSIQQFSTPVVAGLQKAFYRLTTTPPAASVVAPVAAAQLLAPASQGQVFAEDREVGANCCRCGSH